MNKAHLGIPISAKLIMAVIVLSVVATFIYKIHGVMAPFAIAFVLAYVLAPVVDRMEGSGMGRTVSILLLFLGLFTLLGFGAFSLGNKLTAEMIELSDRIHRDEVTVREFSITNSGIDPIILDGFVIKHIAGPDNPVPFSVLGVDDLPTRILPGKDHVVSVAFSPDSMAFCAAVLKFELTNYGYPPEQLPSLHLVGNEQFKSSNEIVSFPRYVFSSPIVLSEKVLDMGQAGPNVLTDLAVSAETIQPMISEYTGEDFDLVGSLKQEGKSVLDVFKGNATELLGGVVSGLTFVVIVPFVAFFFLQEGRTMIRKTVALVPNAYFELTLNLIHQINSQIGGYIRGTILATSIVATLSIIGLSVIGLKYALPVGLLAGLANMIPFLGPLIGIISASLVALTTGGDAVVSLLGEVVLVFVLIQVLDNVIIQPAVVAKSVEMHPLMVLFVVMVGSQLMGIVGMLVAVPVTGILKVVAGSFQEALRLYQR